MILSSTYYVICFFIIGLFLGSFYNVVSLRIPKKESIIHPPSHCPKCNHKLSWYELVPVISYILLLGRCKKCKCRISFIYPFNELVTGILFATCYHVFGFSLDLLYALVFISGLIIIIIADFKYMIIPDEIIIFLGISLFILKIFTTDFGTALISLFNGSMAFLIMYIVKYLGDISFKKESLGGGDVKLMFIFGLVFGVEISVIIIFLGSIIAFPVALFLLIRKKVNILPFGPFLAIVAIALFLLNITIDDIMTFLFL
jgi:leader peptidase (prepilin peptidase)/N-methyltransferase